ncbi:MAG: glycerophosphodiester phosphodiesterase [Chitinophagaceae bacterium]|nr:glycerophosphodiester phosphodiesterase [Chitinophagaceae bacterium]
MKNLLVMVASLLSLSLSAQDFDVQAHRGGTGLMPENTIPAMLNAVKLGVRTLELDCVISADNKVVVSHDPYMSSEIMLKPDGSMISKKEEKSHVIYKMPYDSVRLYDAGSKPHPRYPAQQKFKIFKPLLSVLIDSVEAYIMANHLKPVFYNIETKSSPKGDGVFHPAPSEFVRLVMEVIESKGIATRTTVQSFDPRTLQVVHKTFPGQRLALLVENNEGLDANIKKLGFVPSIYSPYYLMVDPEMVKIAHGKKMLVLPWTVDKEEDIQSLISYGVDGIISNYPDRLVKIIGSYQK